MEIKHIMQISMAFYMVVVLYIGIVAAKMTKTTADYYLGGRTLGPWITAMSAEASDMSSWLLMGLPGLAYFSGLADAAWTAIGLAVGTYLNWRIVARRLRRYSIVANNSITLPDFFSNRFHDERKILMTISALIILFFFIPYTASGFVACGKLFESLFGYNYTVAMLVSAVVVVAYTAIGGFLAESLTDLIQGLVMIVALMIIMSFAVYHAGGFGAVVDNAKEMSGYFDMFLTHVRKTGEASPYGIFAIVSTLAWGLGYFGMPHILLRFMAIRSTKEVKKSRIIGTTWCFISLVAAVFIGIAGTAAMPDLLKGIAEPKAADAEVIFIKLTQLLAENGVLLAFFGGVIISGILAATMSTSDSQLLVASSSISENFFKNLKKDATNKQLMWVSRATVVLIAIIAAIMALDPDSSIFNIVSYSWAGFGAAFGPVMLFALFWKRTTLWGAFAGMISGSATVILWNLLEKWVGGIFELYELLPAFIIACGFILVVSLLGKEPSKEIQREFELVQSSAVVE